MMGRVRRWLQPSLVRRLVLAQVTTAALLWLALAAYVARDMSMSTAESDSSQMRQGAAMVLPLVQALDKQPELILQTMQRIDEFQRSSLTPTDAQSMLQMPRLYLWRDGQLLYRSVDAKTVPVIAQTETLFEVAVDGLPWRVYAEDSADGRTRFAVMTPGTPAAAGLSPWSRGWLVLPLLVSLPLLVVPAWLSVRFALRPWARLSSEIATRGAGDLSPLVFTPRHGELSPLSRAVDQLLGRLRHSRERERSFIADAAHELRTPIAAIQINAEALQERPLPAEARQLLEGLLRSNARAGRLVAQLLALTRSDASSARHAGHVVEVEALVQDALAQWSTVAQGQQIELDLESQAGLRVEGDAEALRMLVDNLVGNAIKYAPAGSTVRVRALRNGGHVQLEVLDEGPGIAPGLRTRVFDRFYRIPGQTQPGSGLGLAIVKSVADQHGASVELTDGPNAKGLLVRVRLAA
jgi:two-component system sensor histidine kinase QseC